MAACPGRTARGCCRGSSSAGAAVFKTSHILQQSTRLRVIFSEPLQTTVIKLAGEFKTPILACDLVLHTR